MSDTRPIPLGPRFTEAFAYAMELHGDHARKGTTIPYISHLMAVSALVLEDGGDEDLAIAALLHDGPEDRGGEATLATIRARFGDRVADVVAGLSDTFEDPKPAWRERKEAYLAHLRDADDDVLHVSLADKLHNLRATVRDVRRDGDEVLERFNEESDQLWYYGVLEEVFVEWGGSRLVEEYVRALAALERELSPAPDDDD